MAPKRERKLPAPAPAPAPAVVIARVTRSATVRKRDVEAEEAAPLPPTKKLRVASRKKSDVKKTVDGGEVKVKMDGGEASKTIIVEACKQCNSFKTRAIKVKEGLEDAVSGVIVKINPEKPRRGCFEIRDKDGKMFVSLLSMKRPFKPMKDLDMDEVVKDIVQKIS